ncbi:MAG: hypothetical protein JWP69_1461 [Flaviaesturariibacter sp.]|nr:hypothetical protein [Flaviaesturariibacter sp.]
MNALLKVFCTDKNATEDGFKLGPAIVMMVLILAFIASNVYVLISSMD